MAYTITSYEKRGLGKISMSGTTQVTANTARAFRNVAVGATIKSTSMGTGGSATVTAKTDETHINVNVVDTFAAEDWTYINPALELSGIYYIKHTKSDKPTITPITLKDSDSAYGSVGAGVARDIQLSGWIANATLADREKNIAILESLTDGTQTKHGTCVFAEESPARTSYVYVTSISWQNGRDKPKWLDVMINMTECKNRGSLS